MEIQQASTQKPTGGGGGGLSVVFLQIFRNHQHFDRKKKLNFWENPSIHSKFRDYFGRSIKGIKYFFSHIRMLGKGTRKPESKISQTLMMNQMIKLK